MANEVSNVSACPEANSGKLRMIFSVNIIICILVLPLLIKSLMV